MKTLTGKEYIKESIMSNVGIGLRPSIEEWIRKNGSQWNITLNENTLEVNFLEDFDRKGTSEIFFQIDKAYNITIEKYDGEKFIMPRYAKKIILKNSSKLKQIICKTDCECESLNIENCPLVDFDESFKHCSVPRVSIDGSAIKSMEMFTNVSKALYLSGCRSLDSISGKFDNEVSVFVEYSSVKSLEDFNAKTLNINMCNNLKELEINIPELQTLSITRCTKLSSVVCDSNLVNLKIDNCERLKNVKIANISNSLSLKNLSSFEKLESPEKIDGTAVFIKLPENPKIEAKKVMTR